VWQKFGWQPYKKINWFKKCYGALDMEERLEFYSSHCTIVQCTKRFLIIFSHFDLLYR
jgi:hypothetical protein